MGNRFLMALYRPSEALLDQIFMQRWGLFSKICCFFSIHAADVYAPQQA